MNDVPKSCMSVSSDDGQSIKGHHAKYNSYMLDHPITVVLTVFYTLKNKGLKVYKFMSIQTQEEHIGHIKQSKRD